MKPTDVRDTCLKFSAQASEASRQLAFAGLGLVWFLRTGETGIKAVAPELLLPAALLMLGLGLDLLHYVAGTAIWTTFKRVIELRITPEEAEFKAPRWFNWPTNVCFWGKLVAVLAAYALLLRFMWRAVI